MKINLRTFFSAFLIALFAYAIFMAKDFARGAEVFPLAVAIPAFILCLFELSHDLKASGSKAAKEDFVDIAVDESTPAKVAYIGALKYLGWILALYVAGWIIGFKLAITIFFLLFLKIEGHASWRITLLVTAIAAYLVVIHLTVIMDIYWPEYLLEPWLSKLPLL